MIEKKLPEGWEWKALGKVADITMGQSPPGSSYNQIRDGCAFLQGNADFGDESPTPSCWTTEPRKRAKIGSVLFSVRAPIGAVNIANTDYCIGRGLSSISLHQGENKYLYYLLRHLKSSLEQKGTGSTFKAISKSTLEELVIPLPPLETQRKIVAILEKAEATQRLRAEADALMEDLVQSVFLKMFGDPVTNPMGWDTLPLEKLCLDNFGGGTPSKSNKDYYKGTIPWVTPKDMKDDFITDSLDHITEKAIQESATRKVPKDAFLMVIRSGILKRKLPVAIACCEVTINQDMKAFVLKQEMVHPYFMLYFFKSYQRHLLNRVRSVTADNLEFDQIKKSEVIIPPLDFQMKFVKIIEKILAMRNSQEEVCCETTLLRESLVSKAFTGELTA